MLLLLLLRARRLARCALVVCVRLIGRAVAEIGGGESLLIVAQYIQQRRQHLVPCEKVRLRVRATSRAAS